MYHYYLLVDAWSLAYDSQIPKHCVYEIYLLQRTLSNIVSIKLFNKQNVMETRQGKLF